MKLRRMKIAVWSMCLIFLVGLSFSGTGYLLCIGDDGHVEFKTRCLTCVDEAEEVCESKVSDDVHSEHSNCFDCYDIELVSQLSSIFIRYIDADHATDFDSVPLADSYLSPKSASIDNPQFIKFHLAYGQSPPLISIDTTVLLC